MAREHRPPRDPAQCHALAQDGDLLLHPRGVGREAGQPLSDLRLGVDRHVAREPCERRLRAGEGAQRQRSPAGEGLQRHLLLVAGDEQGQGHAIRLAEPGRVDRPGAGKHLPGEGVASGQCRSRAVGEPVVEAQVAAQRGPFRRGARLGLPGFVEQGRQGLMGLGGVGCRGGRRNGHCGARCGGRAGQRQPAEGGGNEAGGERLAQIGSPEHGAAASLPAPCRRDERMRHAPG